MFGMIMLGKKEEKAEERQEIVGKWVVEAIPGRRGRVRCVQLTVRL